MPKSSNGKKAAVRHHLARSGGRPHRAVTPLSPDLSSFWSTADPLTKLNTSQRNTLSHNPNSISGKRITWKRDKSGKEDSRQLKVYNNFWFIEYIVEGDQGPILHPTLGFTRTEVCSAMATTSAS